MMPAVEHNFNRFHHAGAWAGKILCKALGCLILFFSYPQFSYAQGVQTQGVQTQEVQTQEVQATKVQTETQTNERKPYVNQDMLGLWTSESPTQITEIAFSEKGDGSVLWKTIKEGKVVEGSNKEGFLYYVLDPKLSDVIVISFFSASRQSALLPSSSIAPPTTPQTGESPTPSPPTTPQTAVAEKPVTGEFLKGSKYKISSDVKKYPGLLCLVKLKPSGEEDLDEVFRLVQKRTSSATLSSGETTKELRKNFSGSWIQRDARGSVRLQIGEKEQAGNAMLTYTISRTRRTFSRSATYYIDPLTQILSLDVLEEGNRLVRYFFKPFGSDVLQEVTATGFHKVSPRGGVTSFARDVTLLQ